MQRQRVLGEFSMMVGSDGAAESVGQTAHGGALENVRVRDIRRLIERQGYRCALTGIPLTPELATIDHRIPIRSGGRHAIDNLQVLHRTVNSAKGTLDESEFIAMCRAVVAWADCSPSEV
jgi:hypothetical protein